MELKWRAPPARPAEDFLLGAATAPLAQPPRRCSPPQGRGLKVTACGSRAVLQGGGSKRPLYPIARPTEQPSASAPITCPQGTDG